MTNFNYDWLIFLEGNLQAALMVSLLSVWVLVGLFFYLNRYTRREYFSMWTAAWSFYALWLSLGLRYNDPAVTSMVFIIKQCCVSLSAVFLLWGSLRFLGIPVRQRIFGGFMSFLIVWTFVSPRWVTTVSTTLTPNEIKDLPAIVERLKSGSDPVSSYIWYQLSPTNQDVLGAFQPATSGTHRARTIVFKAFNKVISGPLFYEPRRFQDIKLGSETFDLLNHARAGAFSPHLNRLLLEDTYPPPLLSTNLNAVLQVESPLFILLGVSSLFAGWCFFRLRKYKSFVGAGMLSLGFLLWGAYLICYPLSQRDANFSSAGFFVAAVLQLFIAVSMIVLVLEEVRFNADQARLEVAAVRREKDALQAKVITAEEECQSLYNQVRLTEGTQKAYDELRRTQQTVVQQERLRALGQMASGVAHDINNALSPITAYAELLLTSLPDLEDASRQRLERIRTAADDVAEIVARMRQFYRRDLDTDQLDRLDANQAVAEVAELTRPRWRDLAQRRGISIQIKYELEPNLPAMLCNPGELREALTNVVFNAVDALPRGGVITVVTRTAPAPDQVPGIGARQELQLEVRDNGIGMDEKVRARCLEPFFSTKIQSGGTGLGLAMVYGMVRRHEGRVEVDSAPNQGTCLRLIFPIHNRPAPAAQTLDMPVEACRPLHILYIDDEPELRLLIHDLLEVNHHIVSVADGGKQGLEMFRANLLAGEPFEIVITDLGMPEVDGYQVARAVKAESPDTPVIMLTGWGTMMKEDGEKAPGVDALLSKPPRFQELNELLDKLTANAALRRTPALV